MIGGTRSSLLCTQCTACLQTQRSLAPISIRTSIRNPRAFSTSPLRENTKPNNGVGSTEAKEAKEEGALSRRLSEMTEEALLEGGRSARKNIQEAGFAEDLKRELEEKLKASTFRSDNAQAFSMLDIPVCSCSSRCTMFVIK